MNTSGGESSFQSFCIIEVAAEDIFKSLDFNDKIKYPEDWKLPM